MLPLLIATNNQGKVEEIKKILEELNVKVVSLKDVGIEIEIEENGNSFQENALIKAQEVAKLTKDYLVISDDSGLVIDYLDGKPGIYSARFAGDMPQNDRNNLILTMLQGVSMEKRTARFVCSIAIAKPDGTFNTVEGECDGYIDFESKGTNGFGYDPIFYVQEYDMTFGEMNTDIKNKISHRGKALEQLKEYLKKLM
jgi:XTP/dITP diphosphohydrolase